MWKILLLFLVVGCGSAPTKPHRSEVEWPVTQKSRPTILDLELQPYVDDFYLEAETRGVATSTLVESIGFTETYGDSNAIGRCSQYGTTDKVVMRVATVLKPYWDLASEISRRTLVFHELGHCALGVAHSEDGGHIMSKYILDDIYAELNWPELLDELFASKPGDFTKLRGPIELQLEFDR